MSPEGSNQLINAFLLSFTSPQKDEGFFFRLFIIIAIHIFLFSYQRLIK